MDKNLPAGEFKQRCLAVLDQVAEEHCEYVITKRGRPVARLAPIASAREHEEQILARLRGRGRLLVDVKVLLRPSSDDAGWSADATHK